MKTQIKRAAALLIVAAGLSASAPAEDYSGTIQATITALEGGPPNSGWYLGQEFNGAYKYSSDTIDGLFTSNGTGDLRGQLWGMAFPAAHYPGWEGVFVFDAQLTVVDGRATSFGFGWFTDLDEFDCSGTQFGFSTYAYSPVLHASGVLSFGPVHTPDAGSTWFLMLGTGALIGCLRKSWGCVFPSRGAGS
jgi:hypothetical protein